VTGLLPADWRHAPDHLVGLVAALAPPPPPGPTGEPTREQWYGQLRRVVDEVWSAGWMAGAADHAARTPPGPMVLQGPAETGLPPALAALARPGGQLRASVNARSGGQS